MRSGRLGDRLARLSDEEVPPRARLILEPIFGSGL
jgi:hypothetical protein